MKAVLIAIGLIGVVGIILIILSAGDDNQPRMTGTGQDAGSSRQNQDPDQRERSQTVATTEVTIKDFVYTPAMIRVKVGDTVTWTNQDSVAHNVVSDDGSPEAPDGPLLNKGESYKFKFTKAGTYTYHCSPHPQMTGTVVVE